MLICLTTGQRGQTIHKMDVSYIQEMDGRYRITVCDKLKQTKPGRHLEAIDLFVYPNDKKLFVTEHLKEYLHRTEQLRKGHSKLLLSYFKSFKPVSKDTISRWIKQILEAAGIDIKKYSAHSSKAASTSSCKAKGLNLAEIMKSAGWSKFEHFRQIFLINLLLPLKQILAQYCQIRAQCCLCSSRSANKTVYIGRVVRSTGL